MKKLVFDTKNNLYFPFFEWIILFLFLCILIYYIVYGRKYLSYQLNKNLNNHKQSTSIKIKKDYIFAKLFIPIFLLFGLLISSFMTYSRTVSYLELKDILQNKTYKVIEGMVQNFQQMPYSGHQNESFEVNSIRFEYSDYTGNNYFFKNTKSHGGPITGEGQKVKIYYLEQVPIKKICIPILPKCIEFYISKNKIIKLWVETKKP